MTNLHSSRGGGAVATLGESAAFVTPENVARARTALPGDGYLLIDGGYDRDACREIVSFVDGYSAPGSTETNYAGTELRIWDAHQKHPLLAAFSRDCDRFLTHVVGREMRSHTLLAIRNRALDPADRNSTMGRWHLDSFMRQLKVFLFLTDTTEISGPFECLPRTHQTAFKVSMLLRGNYIRPAEIVRRGRRTYSKLDDALVARLSAAGYPSLPVLCRAGTVMVVDSSAIHRARPCLEGSRYALTAYYR